MKTFIKFLPAIVSAVLTVACSQVPQKEEASVTVQDVTGDNQIQGRIIGQLESGNKFSRLRIGMSRSEVESLIGFPGELSAQPTGTASLPYYFGSDSWRTESYYRGQGRLVFNADSRLVLIDVTENARK